MRLALQPVSDMDGSAVVTLKLNFNHYAISGGRSSVGRVKDNIDLPLTPIYPGKVAYVSIICTLEVWGYCIFSALQAFRRNMTD